MRVLLAAVLISLPVAADAYAGEVYEITSTDGKKTIKYEVRFGGGFDVDMWTAFCPKSKKFVYVSWLRGKEKPPAIAATIWDHHTGRTIHLYRLPGFPDPLPVIHGITDLKVCPFTGDKNFKAVRTKFYD